MLLITVDEKERKGETLFDVLKKEERGEERAGYTKIQWGKNRLGGKRHPLERRRGGGKEWGEDEVL